MMDPNDVEPSSAFSEEEKLPEGIDEDTNWFGKNLEDESDNTEHEALNPELEGSSSKSPEEIMETDSQSELLTGSLESKKDDLTELKDIALDSKKHDISNELKEMFDEKSSDAEELQETTLSKHSLDTEITKEDKLKDIVPDDILGKDDSFDGLDNDDLHQELEAHLDYEKSKALISSLPDDTSAELPEDSPSEGIESLQEENPPELQKDPEVEKSLNDLNYEGKSDILENLTKNMDTKEIDEIMDQTLPEEEDGGSKEMPLEIEETTSSVVEDTISKDKAQDVIDEVDRAKADEDTEEIVNQVDKIEITKENMMVEFAHDDGSQVLIQINTEQSQPDEEEMLKPDSVVMETSDGQTIVFSTNETTEPTAEDKDITSKVEGGAEFLEAVTGKFDDVLVPIKEDDQEKEKPEPLSQSVPSEENVDSFVEIKQEFPKILEEPAKCCCITSCKSGKSTLKTTFRYFKPPVNKMLYKKWEYIFNQARQKLSPDSLICELHFRTGLIYKRGLDKNGKISWALREGALPKLSPTGILRVAGNTVPSPSTTVQVVKKIDSPSAKPVIETKVSPSAVTTQKVLTKKILQKPVKTVVSKVTNEVTDIGFLYKNPELVQAAQEELTTLDVLVCGECHSVFHILELFQAHKMAANCSGESNFKGNPSEPKPQVWAFLLWKSAQAKVADVESSWRLYQRWCKMDENVRSSWIAAGQFLQEGNAIASLKLVEDPVLPPAKRPGRPPLRYRDSEDEDYVGANKMKKLKTPVRSVTPVQNENVDLGGAGDALTFDDPEPMEVVENTHMSPAKKVADEVDETLAKLNRQKPEMLTTEVEIKQEVLSDDELGENKENAQGKSNKELELLFSADSSQVHNCSKCLKEITDSRREMYCATGCYGYYHVECTQLQNVKNMLKMNKGRRTFWQCDSCRELPTPQAGPQKPKEEPQKKNPEEEEYVVEKIVSRRYNIKKKHFEYLLKWEGYPPEQNTWEPAENLGTCQHLLKAFEEALAKQQAAKQAAANRLAGGIPKDLASKIKPPIIKKKEVSTPIPSAPLVDSSTGRPVRSSKKKAMDQVKVWCGSITKPSEDDNFGMKRKLSDDSDYDEEVVVKRVKMEVESDEDTSHDSSLRRFPTTPAVRGRGRPPAARLGVLGTGNKMSVNGEKESNLAMALGLESDDEDMDDSVPLYPPSISSKKSPTITKVTSLSPHNQQVLVASAKGVMKVDHKEAPKLSSGVFVMSNQSGIVKVDNNKIVNSLGKPGLKKTSVSPTKVISPQKQTSGGVVVLSKSEAGGQPKGIIKKLVAPSPSQEGPKPVPPRPPGVIKPMKPGTAPRPLGVLKPTTPSSGPITRPPPLGIHKPLGIAAGTPKSNFVRGRGTPPLRGRGLTSGLIRRDSLQVTPQQRLLIAKKKAESEESEKSPEKPAVVVTPTRKSLITGEHKMIMPIRSTNKPLQHPMLARGRGRGGFRGRGRGSSLGHLLGRQPPQEIVTQVTEPVKESKLVESDSLLMEFQEPSDSEESDAGLDDPFPKLDDLPPIEPLSPPRPISLCPLTGKVLCKAEGEKTPEPTPPPSPKAPTPPPPPEEPVETHILPDHEIEEDADEQSMEVVTSPVVDPDLSPSPRHQPTTTTIVKDGMICKVEMSPGGTTGTLVEAVPANSTPQGVTEGTVTIKKHSSRSRGLKGPQLSVMPSNSSSTSLGTITVPARKLFQEDMAEDDMVTITGEDGMVYQVSNSELAGNTLLVSSEDGQQQCVYVTTDADGNEDGSTILTLDTAYADAVAQLGTDQVNILSTENGDQFYIKEGDDGEQLVEGEQLMTLEGVEGEMAGEDQSGQVVAQLVEAGEPAPGGSRRVVLLLPDGNLMMTEVDEEQYAALDLDK